MSRITARGGAWIAIAVTAAAWGVFLSYMAWRVFKALS